MKGIGLVATVLVSLLASLTGLAGDLQGKVSDSTGGALPGATVTVIDQSSGQERSATAGYEGRYLFPNLAGGEYLLEVEFSGFQKFVTELTIHDVTTQRNIVLGVGRFTDQIVVTGTLIPTPVDQEGRSVSIITAEDIELRQHRFLFEALQSVPGVQVTRSGSFGSSTDVSIRGLDSDQTLVVQDGIVLNNPATFGNSFNFANFDTSDVERIEVIRGAQSTLYGSDAIGGVINIVTKDGSEGFSSSGFVEGGSFGTFRGAATVRGGTRKVSGRATISGMTTRGFSSAEEANGNTEDDGFENITVSAKGRYEPLETLRLNGVVRYQNSENEFDGFAGQPVDTDEVGQTEELALGGFATLETFSGKLHHRASITYTRVDRLNLTDGQPSFDSLGTRISYEYQGTTKPLEQVTLLFGAEYDVQEATTEVGFGGNQEIKTTSGYGLLQVAPHERVTLSAGVRHDSSSDFGSETPFNGAGAIRLPGIDLTLRGSYSAGFRAPAAGELVFNPGLFAESSSGWDIGLERSFLSERVRLAVTYFDQQVDDLIAFDLAEFTFVNIQEFETSGVEISAYLQPHETLAVDLNYTYLDAFNVSTTITVGNQPNHRFNAEIAWRPMNRLTLSTSVLFNGQELDRAVTLDSFTLLTLRAEYALTDQLDFTVRVENLTNVNYQDNAGFGTAPLSAFAGLRMRF